MSDESIPSGPAAAAQAGDGGQGSASGEAANTSAGAEGDGAGPDARGNGLSDYLNHYGAVRSYFVSVRLGDFDRASNDPDIGDLDSIAHLLGHDDGDSIGEAEAKADQLGDAQGGLEPLHDGLDSGRGQGGAEPQDTPEVTDQFEPEGAGRGSGSEEVMDEEKSVALAVVAGFIAAAIIGRLPLDSEATAEHVADQAVSVATAILERVKA